MKPNSIQQIEKQLGRDLYLAPRHPTLFDGLMVYKAGQGKYAVDEAGILIGLNVQGMELDDAKWAAIERILKTEDESLQVLNVSDNPLTKFELSSVTQALRELDIEENTIQNIPEETMKQGSAATLRFLKNLSTQGAEELYEGKVLIVGEGGAGKTTLWKLLQDSDYKVEEGKLPSTVGIQIKEGWTFEHIHKPGQDFLVNLWDFGGQEIQYMTHQFFLTNRSFYVLLANGREESPNFSYWLRIIELLGCEKEMEQPLPLLVVLNKKGVVNPKMPYDVETVREDYPKLAVIREELDFKKDKEKVKVLIKDIKKMLCEEMAHLPIPFPRYWKGVREDLYELRRTKKHITAEKFKAVCKDNGIDVGDEQQRNDLSQLLHDLGIILHFKDHIRLKDFIVLNPQWAVNAIYKIMEHEEVKAVNQGRFDEELLKKIWTEKDYSVEEQGKLLNLMLKGDLEVCFEAEEQGKTIFIAPQLLPEEKPNNINWVKSANNLRYIYHYPFMPKGLIGRLIVRLSKDDKIESDENHKKMVWVKGLILQKDNCRARVQHIFDKEKGRDIIEIEVHGAEAEDRKNVLRDIRQELDAPRGIHGKSFPTLHVYQKIPCNCEACKKSLTPFEHDYNKLIENKKANGAEAVSQCQNSFKFIPVQQLLEGVFKADEMRENLEDKAPKQNEIHNHNHIKIENIMPKPVTPGPSNDPSNIFVYAIVFLVIAFVVFAYLSSLSVLKSIVGIVAIVLLGSLLGAFQLKNDGKISEKGFLELMFGILKKIPPLNLFLKDK